MSPGYLNRQSLLGEHRELHGLASILRHGKRGYSNHPETRRWTGCISGLARRHAQLAAEMALRGYHDRSPLAARGATRWPPAFVTPPNDQYERLRIKYADRPRGRIDLPRNPGELWAQHKYSLLARDPESYRVLGRRVARLRRGADLGRLAEELALTLRVKPTPGSRVTAIEHMWGYVSGTATTAQRRAASTSPGAMLWVTCALAVLHRQPYLLASTALSDLSA